MDIAAAKQQIKNTVKIYLQKDALGRYRIPLVHQRPIFLLGAPGLGKTAIMEQIAEEMGLGLVSYSMTHHTRQSALGLPIIVEKEYGGKRYSVSEYTMSEIIASVYDCMGRTGRTEGILFLDEINCVSETLAPAMLLFLQYKVFGGHQIPPGWVIVTAGNPPRFNKSVRAFDAATRDRLKVLEVEPSYGAWKPYALAKGVSRCVLSYLEIRQEEFYQVETTVDGVNVVTPRAWEDLAEIIRYHEQLGLPVDEALTSQYLQNRQTARDFALYYALYQKYRHAYQIPALLEGSWTPDTLEQVRSARMDERLSLVSLLLEAVFKEMHSCTLRHDALALGAASLKKARPALEKPRDPLVELAALEEDWRSAAQAAPAAQQAAWMALLELAAGWHAGLAEAAPYEALRVRYRQEVTLLQHRVKETQAKLGHLLDFLQAAFGPGTELNLAVHDLTVTPEAAAFLGQFLSRDYLEASRSLMLPRQEQQLLQEINLTDLTEDTDG